MMSPGAHVNNHFLMSPGRRVNRTCSPSEAQLSASEAQLPGKKSECWASEAWHLEGRGVRFLRVELSGGASNRDAFGNIVEIPGTPDPQSAAGKGDAKNALGIVEIEIYEPPAGRQVTVSRNE
jgi:hypothetical protein